MQALRKRNDSTGFISLQDDYADKEEIFSGVIEKFKCLKCDEVLELRRRLN